MTTSLTQLPGWSTVEVQPLASYVGIKEIQSSPLTRGEYNKLRGWEPPVGEDQSVKGYVVVYPDGYVSWSPADVFENSYRTSGNLTYPMALFLAQSFGARISRSGWNGKQQYVFKVVGAALALGLHANYGDPTSDNNPECEDSLFLKNAQNKLVPWVASQGDTSATDWCADF